MYRSAADPGKDNLPAIDGWWPPFIIVHAECQVTSTNQDVGTGCVLADSRGQNSVTTLAARSIPVQLAMALV